MTLSIEHSSIGSAAVVSVRGDVDASTAGLLRTELDHVLDGGTTVLVVDLLGVEFVDSSGLGTLVAARNHALRTGASVAIACSSSAVLRMLRITGLDRIFTVHNSLDAVRAAYAPDEATSS